MNRLANFASLAASGHHVGRAGSGLPWAGEWVSLFDGQTFSGWTQGGGAENEQVGGRRRGHRGLGQALDALQPQGRLQELPVPGRGQDQRSRQFGNVLPLPRRTNGNFSKGYEAQIDSTHRDPIRTGSIYGFVHIYKQIVPPDTWFTYEVECVDKNWRGKNVPHIKVWVNGELLYELHRVDQGLGPGLFRLPAARPGQQGRDPQDRGEGAGRDRQVDVLTCPH